jgi:LysR family hydrogen peroxide-inducible transcriptional activator
MNFTQLEYLRELRDSGSFSLAAEKVGVTQPALSLQIQKLEEEMGFKLIDRTKRPFVLTEEGLIFYEKAVEILKQVELLKDISVSLAEEVQGTLKVGIIPTVAPYLVPLFIHQLNKDFPLLNIDITEMKTVDIVAGIKTGNIDCGIISTPISSKNLTFIPLFYEKFFAYLAETHPLFKQDTLEITEIAETDIWYLEEGNCFQNQVNSICRINKQAQKEQNLVYRSNSIESLRRIVENRSGATFIPELATINIPAEQEDLIKEFASGQPFREISLVLQKSHIKEKRIDAFQKIIQNNIPKRMLEKPDSWVVDTML